MDAEEKQDIDFVIDTLQSIENDTNCIPEFMMDRIKSSIIILKFYGGESKLKPLEKQYTKVFYTVHIGFFKKKQQIEFDYLITDEEIVEYFEERYPNNKVTWHK